MVGISCAKDVTWVMLFLGVEKVKQLYYKINKILKTYSLKTFTPFTPKEMGS